MQGPGGTQKGRRRRLWCVRLRVRECGGGFRRAVAVGDLWTAGFMYPTEVHMMLGSSYDA